MRNLLNAKGDSFFVYQRAVRRNLSAKAHFYEQSRHFLRQVSVSDGFVFERRCYVNGFTGQVAFCCLFNPIPKFGVRLSGEQPRDSYEKQCENGSKVVHVVK